MVRLMLTLTPVVCMLGGIALNVTFDHFLSNDEEGEAGKIAKSELKKDKKAKNNEDDEEEGTPIAIKEQLFITWINF